MKVDTIDKDSVEARRTELDFDEVKLVTSAFFAWEPGPMAGLLVRVLSAVTAPLERGSHYGRPLPGEPHRARYVVDGPLTVFGLYGASFRRRVLLASRLKRKGPINMVEMAPGDGRRGASRLRTAAFAWRRRTQAERMLASLGALFEIEAQEETRTGLFGLETLLALQAHSDFSLIVVPVVHTSHQVTKDAPPDSISGAVERVRPWNLVRKAMSLIRTVRTGSLKNGRPIALVDWMEEAGIQGMDLPARVEAVRMELSSRMVAERRACEGPPQLPAREVKRRVLSDPLLAAYMQEHAIRYGKTPDEVLALAREYVDEIAADYRVGVVRWFARFVDFLFDRILDGIEVDRRGIRFLSESESRSRLVLVCSHKSYVDPLLIGYAMFRSGLVPPHQAAGLNLSFWPVGWLLRHSGAFFLRRTFRGETLYREVFCSYVRYLIAGNFTTALYVEGTRSRDGKLTRPKLGFMGILEDLLKMGVCGDITLVPVYLGYDKVPEESAHVREMSGGRKIGESVKGFARIYKQLNTSLGKAYLKFGEPFSMKSALEVSDLEGVALEACRRINAVTPLTSRSAASAAILASGEDRVGREEIRRRAGELIGVSEALGVPLSTDSRSVDRAIEQLVSEGLIPKLPGDGAEVYEAGGIKRRFLEYNKNIALHHFACESMACAVAMKAGRQELENSLADALFLADLLDEEFAFTARDELGAALKRALDGLSKNEAWPEMLKSLMEPKLEGYLVAAKVIAGRAENSKFSRKEFTNSCFCEGERLLAEGALRREESLSSVTFRSALKKFERMGLVGLDRNNGRGASGSVRVEPLGHPRGAEKLAARIESFLRQGP